MKTVTFNSVEKTKIALMIVIAMYYYLLILALPGIIAVAEGKGAGDFADLIFAKMYSFSPVAFIIVFIIAVATTIWLVKSLRKGNKSLSK